MVARHQPSYQHGQGWQWLLTGVVLILVEAPAGTSGFAFVRFKALPEQVLGREIDLVTWGGLKPGIDDDMRREAVHL